MLNIIIDRSKLRLERFPLNAAEGTQQMKSSPFPTLVQDNETGFLEEVEETSVDFGKCGLNEIFVRHLHDLESNPRLRA